MKRQEIKLQDTRKSGDASPELSKG